MYKRHLNAFYTKRYGQLIDEETDYLRTLIYSTIGWACVHVISTGYIENVQLV